MCVSMFGRSTDGRIHNAANKQRQGAAAVHPLPVSSASIGGEKDLPSVCEWAVRCKRSLTGGPVSAPGLTVSLVPAWMPARSLCQYKEGPAHMMFTSTESRGKMAAC